MEDLYVAMFSDINIQRITLFTTKRIE